MPTNLTSQAAIDIQRDRARVWRALVDPASIKAYMFDTNVASDFKPGSPITWSGEIHGKHYEDKGQILVSDPERRLSYTHFSPLAGQPDIPENYHTVTITLSDAAGKTHVELTQDGNRSADEQKHTSENWQRMLEGMKKLLER